MGVKLGLVLPDQFALTRMSRLASTHEFHDTVLVIFSTVITQALAQGPVPIFCQRTPQMLLHTDLQRTPDLLTTDRDADVKLSGHGVLDAVDHMLGVLPTSSCSFYHNNIIAEPDFLVKSEVSSH